MDARTRQCEVNSTSSRDHARPKKGQHFHFFKNLMYLAPIPIENCRAAYTAVTTFEVSNKRKYIQNNTVNCRGLVSLGGRCAHISAYK